MGVIHGPTLQRAGSYLSLLSVFVHRGFEASPILVVESIAVVLLLDNLEANLGPLREIDKFLNDDSATLNATMQRHDPKIPARRRTATVLESYRWLPAADVLRLLLENPARVANIRDARLLAEKIQTRPYGKALGLRY